MDQLLTISCSVLGAGGQGFYNEQNRPGPCSHRVYGLVESLSTMFLISKLCQRPLVAYQISIPPPPRWQYVLLKRPKFPHSLAA